MEEKKQVPQIRFKGYVDAWEQRKLGDVVDVYDGVHQTPDYTDKGIMFLSVENISTLKSEKYISEEAFNRDFKVYPEKGDVLMTRIGDVGTPNVVETTKKVAFYVSLALLKPTDIDSYFLCNSILSPFFQNGLKERTLVTAIPQKINKDEIGKVSLFVPTSIDEQREIGAFFQSLDNLITLHQRKYLSFYKAGEWLVGENNPVSDYIDFAKKVLRIPQAHEMIARYTVLDKEAKKLILLRPYQIHAIEAIRAASKVGQSGFVWHTTGECVIIVTRRNRSDKQRLRAA